MARPNRESLQAFSETLGEGVSLAFSPRKRSLQESVFFSQYYCEDYGGGDFYSRDGYEGDEARPYEGAMVTAQVLEVTHAVDDGVGRVGDGVPDGSPCRRKVAGIDDMVARVDERVAGVDDHVKAIDDKVAVVIDEGKETRVAIQQVADDMDQVKRNQLRQDLRKWLSPSDPSINHNIACSAHRKQRAEWFFKGSIFTKWKSDGLFLWLHGKPGSGKSVLCSTIIQDVIALRADRLVSMAYFYFDFRDIDKQNRRDLLPSLLTQLSDQSHRHCDILDNLYLKHGSGAQKPSEDELIQCLKDMLTLPD
ncbi:hypothetical protein BGY98DRAFT_1179736, partial [Russula aff. rugulosa BPL654]